MNLKGARRAILAILLVLSCAVFHSAAACAATVRYEVSVADLVEHRFRVAITVEPEGAQTVQFAIPAWTPGYYQILNYQRDIADFQAQDADGQELTVSHPDERTWEVTAGPGAVTASYNVTARDAGFGFFGSHLDEKTGYINGASALMYVVGGKEQPATIAYRLPEGWNLACPLTPSGPDSFTASDYDELIDCPVQMGRFERLDFKVRGIPFAAILVGDTTVNRRALVEVLQKIGAAGIGLFGYAPFKHYYFFIHNSVGNFGGGLEHRSSTVLNVGRFRDARGLIGLAAHEYFHAWNVKQIHPEALGPFDYTQKVRTRALWFAEGVTEYYAWVLPRMAGLTTEQDFLNEAAGSIQSLQRTDARRRVSAEEASLKSWEGGSMGFGGLSYYLKGSLLGLLFDIELRAATDNARSLDDVMRFLEREYGRKNRGYEEDSILRALNTVGGRDFSDLYDRYVRGTEEIPWNDILKEAGLVYEEGTEKTPYLGMTTESGKPDGVAVTIVFDNTPASQAGIKEDDRIMTLDGRRVSYEEWNRAVRNLRVGQRFVLGLQRGGAPLEVTLTVGARETPYRRLAPLPDADERAARIRAGLLRTDRYPR
jgi:predicted metalloprotease with PDZ domain